MITIEHNKELNTMIFTIQGDSEYLKIRDAITEYYKNGPLTKYTLWDYTNVTEGKHLSTEESRMIGNHSMSFMHLRPNGFNLIVVPGILQYGLARVYQAFAEKRENDTQKLRTKIFRSKEEAIAFIRQNDISPKDIK
jgi:hypothetical protein